MNIDRLEKQEKQPMIETARGAIFYRGKFLILEKEATSKNPGAFEFPGGTVKSVEDADHGDQRWREALVREIKEETGINVRDFPSQEVEAFRYYFETNGKDRKGQRRHARLFLIRIPDTENISVAINVTKNEAGISEDHHAGYRWVTPGELTKLVTVLQKNPVTNKEVRLLGRNSRHIKKLLEIVAR